MFVIPLFPALLYALFFITTTFAQGRLDRERIVGPGKLVLNSNGPPGVFYCHGRAANHSKIDQLEASIQTLVTSSPTFELRTEIFNDTTIRVIVTPNGHIGRNRIICHWKDKVASGHRVDLIIGETPGIINKPEKCLAYDYQYVECIFLAPTIARAFRNGFPHLYQFAQLNKQLPGYVLPPNLTNITDNDQLVFRFQPTDRSALSTGVAMNVSMTIHLFGSSEYLFEILPLHTSKVDFRVEKVSRNQLTVLINHTDQISAPQRLCAGHVSQVDDQKKLTLVQDISTTSDKQIPINRLKSSTDYLICLRCYYDRNDPSSNPEECRTVKTDTMISNTLLAVLVAVLVPILIAILAIAWHKRKWLCELLKSRPGEPKITYLDPTTVGDSWSNQYQTGLDSESDTSVNSKLIQPEPEDERRYTDSPTLKTADPPGKSDSSTDYIPQYQSMSNLHSIFEDRQTVAPDTLDLTNKPTSA